jgi:uncharacterized protein
MAISYFGEKESLALNHTRSRKLGDGVLLTTDSGSWAYLTEEEHRQLPKPGEPLKSVLKEKGILLNISNIANYIDDYSRKCQYLFNGTSLHIVVPSLRCNIKCAYCHSKSKGLEEKGFDMSEETAKKTVDFIFQSPSKGITIEFQGGEPLINFDIIRHIVLYAKEKNEKHQKDLKFSLVSNLTLMNEETADFLVKENVGICTSLDGNETVHNKNRQDYRQTAIWLEKIKRRTNINAMLLITRNSIGYEKEIVDEYLRLGLPGIWLKPVNRLGCAKQNWEKIGITPEEYLESWKKALDYIVKINAKQQFIENSVTIILKKILLKDCYNFADMQSPCGAAIAQLAYNHDGSIYTCDEARLFEIFKLGTVDDKYHDILTSADTMSIVRASINDNPVCELCAYKPFCGLCPVCSYSDTNNIISKLPNNRCRILKGMFDHVFEKLIFDEEYRKVFLKWI